MILNDCFIAHFQVNMPVNKLNPSIFGEDMGQSMVSHSFLKFIVYIFFNS